MKKWMKYLLITVCVALFLFLMLPFLTTPSLETDLSQPAKQTAKPQIFTSNPLTALVNRIAKLFGGGKEKATKNSAINARSGMKSPEEELFLSAQPGEKLEGDYIASADTTSSSAGTDSFPKDVYVVPVDNNVEWVLVQQHAPEDSPSGMHEVNVKEDAYTRYVKQERLARTSPATRMDTPQEVPDSKLARIFRPFTRLFGRKESASAAGGTQIASAGSVSSKGRASGSTDPLNRNSAKEVRDFSRAQDVHSAFDNTHKSVKIKRERGDKEKFNNLLNPINIINQAAQLVANTASSNSSSSSQQNDVYQTQQQKYQQMMLERWQAHLLAISEGAEATDQLGKTVLCDVTKGLINTNEQACSALTDEDINKMREANQAAFEEQTQMPFPSAKLVPVLSVADKNTLPQIQADEFDDPKNLLTKEKYQFMLENSNCANTSCFWVANSNQAHQEIEQSVTASGFDFQGDPLHKSDEVEARFLQEKLAALPPDATDEQKEELRDSVSKSPTPYVLYNEQDIDQWRQQLSSAPEDDLTFVYVASGAQALFNPNNNSYTPEENLGFAGHVIPGKNAQALTSDEQTVEDRATIFREDVANHVLFMQEGAQDIQRDATQQAVGNTLAPALDKIQEELDKELSKIKK